MTVNSVFANFFTTNFIFIFIYVNTDECIEKIIKDLMDKKNMWC